MSLTALLVLVPAAAGALAALVALGIARLFKVKRRRRWVAAALVSGVVLVGAGAVERLAWNRLFHPEPEDVQRIFHAAQAAVRKLRQQTDADIRALPEYQAWADEQRRRGAREDELLPLLRRVERRGVARLEEPPMAARVVATRYLLNNIDDERQCAALLKGDLSDDEMDLVLGTRSSSPEMVEGWFQLAREATVAELRKTPAPPPDPVRAREALERMAAKLPEGDRERLMRYLQSYAVAPDHEACSWGRTIYDQLLKLESGSTEFIRYLYAPP